MFTPVAAAHVSPSFGVVAERYRRAGQLDRAVALCREGLTAFPDYLAARVTLGYALMDQGQEREAHRELRWVLERAPDNLAAIRGLAELHSRGVEESDAHPGDFAALTMATDAPSSELDAPLSLGLAPETEVVHAPPAVDPLPSVVLPMFDVAHELESIDPVVEPLMLESLDPVVEPAAFASIDPMVEAVAFESLDPVIEPAVLESLDPALDPIEAPAVALELAEPVAQDLTVSLGGFGQLDVDPPLEPFTEVAHFEIEDVIDEADDVVPFDFEGDALEPVDIFEPAVAELPLTAAPPVVAAAEPVPVPELSAGPIALLDEWLTRIRARRSELLSEYAAG